MLNGLTLLFTHSHDLPIPSPPLVPILLVGLKTDLRQDPHTLQMLAAQGSRPVTPEQGSAVAREIGAARYIECSAKNRVGVQEVFEAALKEACRSRGWGMGRGRIAGGGAGGGGGGGGGRRRNKNCLVL